MLDGFDCLSEFVDENKKLCQTMPKPPKEEILEIQMRKSELFIAYANRIQGSKKNDFMEQAKKMLSCIIEEYEQLGLDKRAKLGKDLLNSISPTN